MCWPHGQPPSRLPADPLVHAALVARGHRARTGHRGGGGAVEAPRTLQRHVRRIRDRARRAGNSCWRLLSNPLRFRACAASWPAVADTSWSFRTDGSHDARCGPRRDPFRNRQGAGPRRSSSVRRRDGVFRGTGAVRNTESCPALAFDGGATCVDRRRERRETSRPGTGGELLVAFAPAAGRRDVGAGGCDVASRTPWCRPPPGIQKQRMAARGETTEPHAIRCAAPAAARRGPPQLPGPHSSARAGSRPSSGCAP